LEREQIYGDGVNVAAGRAFTRPAAAAPAKPIMIRKINVKTPVAYRPYEKTPLADIRWSEVNLENSVRAASLFS
jgi:hypothetical protein